MSMRADPATRLYRLGLRLFSREFRARYADELVRVFAEGRRDARKAGRRAMLGYEARILADLVASAAHERLSTMNRTSLVLTPAAIVCGLLATWVDFHATEVQATLLVFLVTSFVLGVATPRGAWRWALLIAVWLPAVQLVAFALRHAGPAAGHPYWSRLAILLPALAACLAGAYAGALLRLLLRGARRDARSGGAI
jgi:hypothetical protein